MQLGTNIRNWGPTATPECIACLRALRGPVHLGLDLDQRSHRTAAEF